MTDHKVLSTQYTTENELRKNTEQLRKKITSIHVGSYM